LVWTFSSSSSEVEESVEWAHSSWLWLLSSLFLLWLCTLSVQFCSAAWALIVVFQPSCQAGLIERVATWQFTALVSIGANFLQADVTVSLFTSLHWWEVLKELLADTTRMWLLLFSFEGEESWHATEHTFEWVSASKVHVVVVHVVNVYLRTHVRITGIMRHVRLSRTISIGDSY